MLNYIYYTYYIYYKLRINISIVSIKYIIKFTYTINSLYYIISYSIYNKYITIFHQPIAQRSQSMASVPTVLQNSAWSRLGAMAQRYSSAAELRRCVLRRVRRIHPTGFSRFHVYFAGKNGWKCLEGLRVPTFLVVTETPGTCADLSKANGRFPGHLSRSAHPWITWSDQNCCVFNQGPIAGNLGPKWEVRKKNAGS